MKQDYHLTYYVSRGRTAVSSFELSLSPLWPYLTKVTNKLTLAQFYIKMKWPIGGERSWFEDSANVFAQSTSRKDGAQSLVGEMGRLIFKTSKYKITRFTKREVHVWCSRTGNFTYVVRTRHSYFIGWMHCTRYACSNSYAIWAKLWLQLGVRPCWLQI